MRTSCEHCGGMGYRETTANELTKAGQVVGIVNGWSVTSDNHNRITLDEVLVKGDWSGVLNYAGANIIIVAVREQVGLEVGPQGARGPLLKGVICDLVTV